MDVLLDQLEAEWERVAAEPRTSRHLNGVLRIAGISSVAELPGWSRSAPRARADAVLLQLATAARAGDQLAATTLLHVLWPGVLGLVRRWRSIGDLDERASAAVSAVYARICSYPVERRPRSVAANVILDAAKDLRRQAAQLTTEPVGLSPIEDGAETTQLSSSEELAALLSEAIASGVLSVEEAGLIARSRIGGTSLTELDPHSRLRTIQRRRQTAERRLATSLAA
jgi:hypothetical protein